MQLKVDLCYTRRGVQYLSLTIFRVFLCKRIKSLSPIAVSLSVLIRCESKPTSLHVDHLQQSESD